MRAARFSLVFEGDAKDKLAFYSHLVFFFPMYEMGSESRSASGHFISLGNEGL